MKKGWIKCKDGLPPLGEEVVISHSIPAYNSHCFRTLGKRIDNDFVLIGDLKVMLFRDNSPFSYVDSWAYNNGQSLPNPCCYPCCIKD